jgi:hypothetical protein
MAEFKLGRIRFVWKGEWATATPYYKDDVVRFGGKVYICQVGHTAAVDFNTDLDIIPTKWNLLSDGQRWAGDWTTNNRYEEGDLVKYGGTVYLCTNGHTSAATTVDGLEDNEPNDWDTFVEGFEWKGNWTVSTRYKFNDIVRRDLIKSKFAASSNFNLLRISWKDDVSDALSTYFTVMS